MFSSPVFIVTTGENGAGLVQGLLDGHPDLATLPFLCDFYLVYARTPSHDRLPHELMRYPMIARVFQGASSRAYGDFRGLSFSPSTFTRRYSEIVSPTASRKDFLAAAFEAFRYTLGLPDRRPVIHIHFTEHLPHYVEDFPDAQFVICDAEVDNMLAYSRYSIPRFLPRRVVSYRQQMEARVAIIRERKAAVEIIPSHQRTHAMFETLLTEPKKIAKQLAMFLSIPHHPALESTTALGKPLACEYPTGRFSIENNRVIARSPQFEVLLHARRTSGWPFRLAHFRPDWPIDRKRTLRDPLRSVSISVRQAVAELKDFVTHR